MEAPASAVQESGRSSALPADEKPRILRDWRHFFRQGLQYRHLTRRLYEHLTRSCGFIVRRGKRAFYEMWITDPAELLGFLDQFDRHAGCPSAETGSADWLEGDHADRKLAERRPVRLYA